MPSLLGSGSEHDLVPYDAAPAGRSLTPVPAERSPDWRRAVNALRHRKWLILTFTALAGAGGWFAARIVKPQYEAHTTIWIDESTRANDRSPLAPGELFDAEGWVNLMQSDAVLDSAVAVDRLYLATPPGTPTSLFAGLAATHTLRPGRYTLHVDGTAHRYTIADADGRVLAQASAGDSLGQAIGLAWQPPADPGVADGAYQVTLRLPSAVARQLAAALTITINQQASFLTATLTGNDAHETARELDAIARQYVSLANRLQRQRLSDLAVVLAQQVGAAQQSLTSAEQDLQQFRVRTITLPHDRATPTTAGTGPAASDMAPADPVLARFSTIEDQLASARGDRKTLERLIAAAADTGASLGEFEDLPVVHNSSALTAEFKSLNDQTAALHKLLERYTDRYPPVLQLKGQITALRVQAIPRTARGLIDEITRRTGSLTDAVAQTADSLRAIPPRATEEARLMRRVALATSLFNTLQQRYDEARIATATAVSDVRILDPAGVPPWPTKDTAPRLILLAVLGGFALASVGSVLVDRWDPRFQYPEQVSRDMGVTILGTIPHVRMTHDGTLDDPAFREGMRSVRMNVAFAHGAAGPVTLTVTSPGSADGKSFVALSLARAFGEAGRRTVIVDADMRRGALHRRCDVLRKPGLTDLLKGDVPLERVVRGTGMPGLDLITSGTRMDDAPELLGGPAMQRLMGDLRAQFDVVVFDSPPMSAGIDPFVLASISSNMLLVIRTGVSVRELTYAKLDALNRLPIRLLGAVLNDVPDTAPFAYYSNYLPGYEASAERQEASADRALAAESR
jgi:capsular exopolysaccharide synthesis family protein